MISGDVFMRWICYMPVHLYICTFEKSCQLRLLYSYDDIYVAYVPNERTILMIKRNISSFGSYESPTADRTRTIEKQQGYK